jgi:hypothetical protein
MVECGPGVKPVGEIFYKRGKRFDYLLPGLIAGVPFKSSGRSAGSKVSTFI